MTNYLGLPHHDGSERYVSNPYPDHGETVELRLLLPGSWRTSEVHLRTIIDGENHFEKPVTIDGAEAIFHLTCDQPIQHYRFHLRGDDGGRWLNGEGLLNWDPDDHFDFKIVPGCRAPDWVAERVWYQIFPDRFATSGRHRIDEPWIQWAEWDDPVEPKYPASMTQLYGGDLDGIRERLDHIVDLGVGGVYLTPVFPGRSNHRYDASTFDEVDPILGGDEALLRLREACDDAGLKLMTDLTLNHTGDGHEWFEAAQADPRSEEAGFYHFIDHPDTYESWLGVSSLPKLDHRNSEMARRLYDGPESVVARYITPPFNLDGWRIDVANMTGRLRDLDMNHEVARITRRTFERLPGLAGDRWLVGEHFFDAAADTPGDGWMGVMNYAGVSRPVTSWLGTEGVLLDMSPGPGQDQRDGFGMARSFDVVRAAMSWTVTMGSMALLSSHDTPRWRSICVSDDAAKIGFGMTLTLPGAPCFFYGDEIGLLGEDNEQSRAPMPWDGNWDRSFLDTYRRLIGVRNGSEALQRGGFRWVHVDADQLVWLRESRRERVLVRAARASGDAVSIDSELLGSDRLVPLYGDAEIRGAELELPRTGPRFDIWKLD
ncbi:MAG: glycoside hydrolase family 13 protein [Acidimicrobiales bacterium]|nr:glycoside hydrolase family 13 protein [Acidimicrobiales bacterium]